MAALYPNLYDRFKSEGVCPICLMEMELAPRFSCYNGHTVCHRCKPYYLACPTCQSPLDETIPGLQPAGDHGQPSPPPTRYAAHPLPEQYREATAPLMDDFLAHERQFWAPPTPQQDQRVAPCTYAHLGCWVKIPQHLRELHESRCQFRPHLEEEQLPTDLSCDRGDLAECAYKALGCNVRTQPWRKSVHEKYCIYKDRGDLVNDLAEGIGSVDIANDGPGDPEQLVACRYRSRGCAVRMPRRRRFVHEQKCNYAKYGEGEDEDEGSRGSPEEDADPEEQMDCRWVEYGCRVRPKRYRKEAHEEKCNYRMEECAFKDHGCDAMFHPSARFAHERSCSFSDQ